MERNYCPQEPVDDTNTHSGLNVGKQKKKSFTDRLAVRLAVSLAIAAVAAAVRFTLPDVYFEVTSHFSNSVDFVSAFNAIGRGLSGESDMSEALKDAYKYAFVGEETDSFQVSHFD